MAYTYRFIDAKGNIIYIGKTVDINRRIADHFSKGHLPKECYSSVARIEYQKHKTESDALVYETYYITKFSPKYNKLQKSKDIPSLELPAKEWKLYKQYKQVNSSTFKPTWGLLQIGYLLFLIYVIINYIASLLH